MTLEPDNARVEVVDKQTNIRNVSVIGNVGHGKSAIIGVLTSSVATRSPEHHATTLCSSVVSATNDNGSKFLLNLLDCPGHPELSSEVTTSLRITDGALLVIDAVDGIAAYTEALIRQAYVERVKPALVFNKLDRAIVDLKLSKEELYKTLERSLRNAKSVASAHGGQTFQPCPENGDVVFASALNGWAFTLRQFAQRCSKQFEIEQSRLVSKLWGENFFDHTTRTWSTLPVDEQGNARERGFNMLVLDPIYRIFDLAQTSNQDDIDSLLQTLEIELAPSERQKHGLELVHSIMKAFIPAHNTLLEMIALHLPSPLVAQRYRMEALYEGPMNDPYALSMQDCDPGGPLMVFVSRLVPSLERGRFYALGRVFSGTARPGQKVYIQGPAYLPGRKEDLFVKPIQAIIRIAGDSAESLEEARAGTVVGLVGIDPYILQNATLSSTGTAFNIKPMRFSSEAIVQVSVAPEMTDGLPKLVEALKRLQKQNAGVNAWVEETGDHILAATGEWHLDCMLKSLQQDIRDIPFTTSPPFVPYRETVRQESIKVNLTKSANKHTRFYLKAMPLDDAVTEAIESGKIGPRNDFKVRASILNEDYGWEVSDARRIWCFGPDISGPNLLVDTTKGVQYLNEIKDSCVAGFQWATKEGVCCEERMRGVRFNILDVTMMSDAIHRGGGQIIPMCRRACYGACLLATPAIQEPVFVTEILLPREHETAIRAAMNHRRVEVFNEREHHESKSMTIQAYLPVAESFGLDDEMQNIAGGQVHVQKAFDHWDLMQGTPLEQGSKLEELVERIRKRKGLKPGIPPLTQFYDKL